MILLKAKFETLKVLSTKTNLVFSTKEELTPEQVLLLQPIVGYLAFNPDEYREEMLGVIKNKRIGIDESELTPSQRLRHIFHCIWMELNDGSDFEDFYKEKMNLICDHYKTKYL